MSKQEDRERHSKRLYSEESAVKKQVKIAKAYGVEVKEPHKLAKHHALNCGNPKCIMCANPRKTFKELTAQEQSFYQEKLWKDDGPND